MVEISMISWIVFMVVFVGTLMIATDAKPFPAFSMFSVMMLTSYLHFDGKLTELLSVFVY